MADDAGAPVGVAVVGAGYWGPNLIRNFSACPLTEVAAVCDAKESALDAIGRRYPAIPRRSSFDDVLADPDVDAVAIATRHDSHASLAAQALRAGKAVFCEKPLALTAAELEDVAAAYAATDAPLLVGFNRRWSPHTRQLVAALPAGVPRAIVCRVNAGPLPASHWTKDAQIGGGRVLGELCHFLDLACALAEAAPVRVFAEPLAGADADAPSDSVVVQVAFACGSVASLQYLGNGDSSVPKERIEVFCGGTVATIDDFRSLEVVHGGKRRRERTRRREKGHRQEVDAFVALARGGGDRDAVAIPAFWSSALTLQVAESLRAGRPLDVALPRGLAPAAAARNGSAEALTVL
jgi:predicted dehydrogenase